MAIPYGRQEILPEDIEAVIRVLKSDFLTQGPAVESFERALAESLGGSLAVVVANGTAALHLAMLAAGVQSGDHVLTVSNTFAATANAALYCGAQVEFVDIDPTTLTIDVDEVERRLKKQGRGYYKVIAVVDFAGYPVDLQRLRSLADEHSAILIEDACHALGAERKFAGSFEGVGNGRKAHMAIHSFHPVKHITTGEGGAVLTSDRELAGKIRLLRSHGITKVDSEFERPADGGWYYEMQQLGFNYRISDILCALGESQLRRLKSNLRRRREIAKFYDEELKEVVQTPAVSSDVLHAYHLYVIQTDKRRALYNFCKERQIFCQVHYVPVHKHPHYVRTQGEVTLPHTEAYYSRALSLPMFHSMTDEMAKTVVRSVREWKNEGSR